MLDKQVSRSILIQNTNGGEESEKGNEEEVLHKVLQGVTL